MMRRTWLLALLFCSSLLSAQVPGSFQQWCQAGGRVTTTGGLNSTTLQQGSYPNCTVTVFLTGTANKATIFSSNTQLPLSNPFTANNDGSFLFYAAVNVLYDVTISGGGGGGLPQPFTFFQIVTSNVFLGIGGTPAVFKTNGVLNGNQGLVNFVSGTNISVTQDGLGNETFTNTFSLSPGGGTAPPGFALPANFFYVKATGSGLLSVSASSVTNLGTQSTTGTLITATEPEGRLFTSTAVASGNIAAGSLVGLGANPAQGQISPGMLQRATARLLTQSVASLRYWVALLDSSGGNIGGSGFATDTPNANYCGFRHSDTTDTNWKAICATSNVAQTVVDTGVATSTTASQVFELSFSPPFVPTTAIFYLNGVQVATITTNLPSAALAMGFGWIVDNKNTATATSTMYNWTEVLFNK